MKNRIFIDLKLEVFVFVLLDINLCEFLDLVIDSHVKFKHIILFDFITLLNNNTGVIFFRVCKSIEGVNTVDTLWFDTIKGILNTNFINDIRIIECLQCDNHVVD